MSKPIELREADFRREINAFTYPEEIKKEFFDYWTEPDRAANPKMRFEKEKTWHLGRRLARWIKNSKTTLPAAIVHKDSKPIPVRPVTDFDRLDLFISEMRKPGVNIPFEDFGKWYDFMKKEKLLKQMTQQDCNDLLTWYKGDKDKCRCAVVQSTLAGYINNELTINDILKARQRLYAK